jgi:FixJ family two-component response regulator
MRAGALQVLVKPAREHELWDVLQEATRLNQQRRRIHREQRESEQRIALLTTKEVQMMERIVAGESNRSMASQFGVCLRTVELRRAKMMKKLDVPSVAGLVRLALVAKNGHFRPTLGAASC